MLPTNPDVDGFHEGFADLIALFQRFRYRPLVRRAIESMGGELTSALLIDIARQWGETTSEDEDKNKKQSPLRQAFKFKGGPDEPVERKAATIRSSKPTIWAPCCCARCSTRSAGSTTTRPRGCARWRRRPASECPAELIDLLVIEAEKLAGQFLNILIRAVDYCPPVDLTLGEYLRAIVTADFDLVPDDPWAIARHLSARSAATASPSMRSAT